MNTLITFGAMFALIAGLVVLYLALSSVNAPLPSLGRRKR
jgi:hypothetical protein